jgi:hypothetical protein
MFLPSSSDDIPTVPSGLDRWSLFDKQNTRVGMKIENAYTLCTDLPCSISQIPRGNRHQTKLGAHELGGVEGRRRRRHQGSRLSCFPSRTRSNVVNRYKWPV